MPDMRQLTRTAFAALINSFGCLDAVAETINARWGGGASKGTLSKKCHGQLEFTLPDVIALEDAAGRFPVTRLLARRLSDPTATSSVCLSEQSGVIATEAGQAVAAVLSAQSSSCADDRARAVTEIDEAMEALVVARSKLLGGEDKTS